MVKNPCISYVKAPKFWKSKYIFITLTEVAAMKLLKLQPYKATVIHALQPRYPANRMKTSNWFLQSVYGGEAGSLQNEPPYQRAKGKHPKINFGSSSGRTSLGEFHPYGRKTERERVVCTCVCARAGRVFLAPLITVMLILLMLSSNTCLTPGKSSTTWCCHAAGSGRQAVEVVW
jgi:hypothetical protein